MIVKLDKTYIDIAIYIINQLKEFDNLYSVIVWEGSDKYAEILKEEVIKKDEGNNE